MRPLGGCAAVVSMIAVSSTAPQDRAGSVKLPVEFTKQFLQKTFDDRQAAETARPGMLGNDLLQCKSDEMLERQPVAQRLLKFHLGKPIKRPQSGALNFTSGS